MEDMFEPRDDEFEFDEIRGAHGRKPKMAILTYMLLMCYNDITGGAVNSSLKCNSLC